MPCTIAAWLSCCCEFCTCWKKTLRNLPSLKLTASLHLKMDGWSWNTSFLLGRCYVSFREGKHEKLADALSIFLGVKNDLKNRGVDLQLQWTVHGYSLFSFLPAPPGFQKTILAQVYTHYICIDGQSLKRATMLAILVQFVVQCLVTCWTIAFLGNLTPILNSQKKKQSWKLQSWCFMVSFFSGGQTFWWFWTYLLESHGPGTSPI